MSYLEEDLNNISHIEFAEQLREKKILVTGATGLVGSLLVRSLIKIGSNVYALVRNPDKARVIYGNETNQIHIVKGDIAGSNWFGQLPDIDYVFHCAAITTSKTMVSKPVETIDTAISGTRNLLDFSICHHVKRFVYISSMEVYGTLPISEIATEDKLGYIDIFKVRSNYPESKRLCENLCIAYQSEYGLDVVIARLAQTFGPGVLPWDNRVFAQFAKSVIENKDIVLHTKGLSEGNYCYSRDLVKGLFTILCKGASGEAYNVVNKETHTTIANMAEMVAHNIAKDRIKVVYDITESKALGYAADVHLKLSGKKLENLGWKAEVGLEDMYRRMIGDMKESIDTNIDYSQVSKASE